MAYDPSLKVNRRDSDATLGADGDAQQLYNNAVGRLKVSQWPGAFVATTGNITTSTTVVGPVDVSRAGAVTVGVSGTFTGVNFTFEASVDGTNYVAIPAQPVALVNTMVTATGVIATQTAAWDISPLLGMSLFRVRATAFATGTATITIAPSPLTTEPAVQVNGAVTATVASTTVTSLVSGVAATSLGKAEDAVHASGDTGVAAWGVRNDNAATSLTSATGDYSPLAVDTNGSQFVRDAPANTPSLANVAGSITSVTLRVANAARRSLIIYNDSTSDMYIAYGATASSTSFTIYLPSLGTTTIPGSEYAGIVTGIWISATGNARVTETTI